MLKTKKAKTMTSCIYKLKVQHDGVEAIISVTAWDKNEAKAKFGKLGFPCDVEWIFN